LAQAVSPQNVFVSTSRPKHPYTPEAMNILSVLLIAIRSHGLLALKAQSQMPSCQITGFLDFHDLKGPLKSSIRNFSISQFYGPLKHANHNNWAPGGWAFQSSHLSQSEQFSRASAEGFNQFLLEQLMLSKWLDSGKCCIAEPGTCAGNEDIVVIPSLFMHLHQEHGYHWKMFFEERNDELIFDYWKTIHTRYFKSGRKPLIVMHSSYTWDLNLEIGLLRVLTRDFPPDLFPDFVQNIVIGGLEAEMRWFDKAKMRNKELPTLMALPYPVGIVNAPRFTSRDGSGFDPDRDRPITIYFEGKWDRGARDGGNHVRPQLQKKLGQYLTASRPNLHVCRNPNARTDAAHICGLQMDGDYETSLNSVFCLEPPGDTLTRSHLYVAVLTGCVPVIFDGGHDSYGPRETSWAWRSTVQAHPSQPVDYKSFAVVYKYDELDRVDWVQELMDMPVTNPARLLELRRGLDNVAPLMRYSRDKHTKDAFDEFFTEVNAIRLSRQ